MNFYDLLFYVSAVFGLAYFFIRQRYSYWKRLNIPFIPPHFPFGNIKELGKTMDSSKLFEKYYHELKGSAPFGGLYFFFNPTILATNLDFIKNILVKDFNHFVGRSGVFSNEIDDPLSGNIFLIDAEKWKRLRTKLTPTFTSTRIRLMFPIILNVAEKLISTISSLINQTNVGCIELELKDILGRFTTDVIGTCAFGIDCNSLNDENSDFRKYGRAVFERPRNSFLKLLFLNNFTELARKLKMKHISDDVSEFFIGSLKETIKYREENNVKRNDFLNMMIQLHKEGKIDGDDMKDNPDTDKLSFNEIAAQCFVFYTAGFETSSSTMMYLLFEFSVNVEMQRKARQEVLDVLQKHGGNFTYEAIMEMQYVDRCIHEALRKYPVVSTLLRKCTKDYPLPNTDIIIRKGTTVTIPVYAIHHDPEIYPNPSIYNPDRFLPEEVQKRHPLSYLPFGEGPRNCIGIRFGLMQTRIGIASLLKHFEFSQCSRSINPLVFSSKTVVLTPESGVWLSIKQI